MQQYNVTGMSCAACSARVEKAVSKVEGVTACSVSLLTNSMGVEGSASPQAVIRAVQDAGYGAAVKGAVKERSEAADALKDTESSKILKRLIASLGFLLVLMYVSMGHMIGLPLPPFLAENHVAQGLTQLLLAAIVMHQPKILYQRLQGLGTPCAEYGHPCGARLGRFVCMERLCALSHDGGAAER